MANQSSEDNEDLNWAFFAKQHDVAPKNHLLSSAAPGLPDISGDCFPSWSNIPYTSDGRKNHQQTPLANIVPQTFSSWTDDFLSDSQDALPKKSSHRRSSSDSVAFLNVPVSFGRIDEITEEDENDCRSVASIPSKGSQEFDRIDEEKLMSMFADIEPFQTQQNRSFKSSMHAISGLERRLTLENLAIPSENNGIHGLLYDGIRTEGIEKLRSEPEVQSAKIEHTLHQSVKGETLTVSTSVDPTLDTKRAKRILANRQSAQRSRVKKLQYISELE
eukprot:c18106_g1_i1 orf=2-823(-)